MPRKGIQHVIEKSDSCAYLRPSGSIQCKLQPDIGLSRGPSLLCDSLHRFSLPLCRLSYSRPEYAWFRKILFPVEAHRNGIGMGRQTLICGKQLNVLMYPLQSFL